MLRRIPSTPLVCLVILLTTAFAAAAWAAGPDESLEILLKPNQAGGIPVQASQRTKPATFAKAAPVILPCAPPPMGISKVKAIPACAPAYAPPCILPAPGPGQWEMSAQVLFARFRGAVQWPRNNWWWGGGGWGQRDVDFNDDLQLPAHKTIGQFTVRYQVRPQWGIRYSILGDELTGSGSNWNNWNPFWFGNQWFGWGQNLQSKWQHQYHRLGVIFDAIRTCGAAVSVFADWVHTDDKLEVGCGVCGFQTSTMSKGSDSAILGLELQRCVQTSWYGGTFSFDHKAGVIFLDSVEGWDLSAGCRYSVPMNYGKWGYLKGGYRYVELKKSNSEYYLKNTIDGGFVELGVIF